MAHFAFTRMNIEPTILRKKIEDLREAGASVWIAVEHPMKTLAPLDEIQEKAEDIDRAKLIVAKQRNGPTSIVDLR